MKMEIQSETLYVKRTVKSDTVRSEFPHEAVTLDFDEDGRLIGVEILAPPHVRRSEGRE